MKHDEHILLLTSWVCWLVSSGYSWLLPRGKRGRGVKLTAHVHLVPRTRMRGRLLPLPHTPSWGGAWSTGTFWPLPDVYTLRHIPCRCGLKLDHSLRNATMKFMGECLPFHPTPVDPWPGLSPLCGMKPYKSDSFQCESVEVTAELHAVLSVSTHQNCYTPC
jgi:hypothetical protein